jgi:hypothetical protein
MTWDPALLKKFNTTGHFRLLNQLRSELRERPLDPPGSAHPGARSRRSSSSRRAIEVRPRGGSRPRRSAPAGTEAPPAPAPLVQSQPASFRDRLNAIDMR